MHKNNRINEALRNIEELKAKNTAVIEPTHEEIRIPLYVKNGIVMEYRSEWRKKSVADPVSEPINNPLAEQIKEVVNDLVNAVVIEPTNKPVAEPINKPVDIPKLEPRQDNLHVETMPVIENNMTYQILESVPVESVPVESVPAMSSDSDEVPALVRLDRINSLVEQLEHIKKSKEVLARSRERRTSTEKKQTSEKRPSLLKRPSLIKKQ